MGDIQVCLKWQPECILHPATSCSWGLSKSSSYSPEPTENIPQEGMSFSPAEGRDQEPLPYHFPPLSIQGACCPQQGRELRGVLCDCSQACALPSPGCPSPRWCHAMCLSDLGTAVLIGGEGVNQQSCRDALWKLEIGGDFRAVKGNVGSGTRG